MQGESEKAGIRLAEAVFAAGKDEPKGVIRKAGVQAALQGCAGKAEVADHAERNVLRLQRGEHILYVGSRRGGGAGVPVNLLCPQGADAQDDVELFKQIVQKRKVIGFQNFVLLGPEPTEVALCLFCGFGQLCGGNVVWVVGCVLQKCGIAFFNVGGRFGA